MYRRERRRIRIKRGSLRICSCSRCRTFRDKWLLICSRYTSRCRSIHGGINNNPWWLHRYLIRPIRHHKESSWKLKMCIHRWLRPLKIWKISRKRWRRFKKRKRWKLKRKKCFNSKLKCKKSYWKRKAVKSKIWGDFWRRMQFIRLKSQRPRLYQSIKLQLKSLKLQHQSLKLRLQSL